MWIPQCYLTCRGGTCCRRCRYVKKSMLTFLNFKVYLHVVDVVVVVVVVVVDVLVAKLAIISWLSQQ